MAPDLFVGEITSLSHLEAKNRHGDGKERHRRESRVDTRVELTAFLSPINDLRDETFRVLLHNSAQPRSFRGSKRTPQASQS